MGIISKGNNKEHLGKESSQKAMEINAVSKTLFWSSAVVVCPWARFD